MRWQSEAMRTYPSVFRTSSGEEEFSVQRDTVLHHGDTDYLAWCSPENSRRVVQRSSGCQYDKVFRSADDLATRSGCGYVHSSQELWRMPTRSSFVSHQISLPLFSHQDRAISSIIPTTKPVCEGWIVYTITRESEFLVSPKKLMNWALDQRPLLRLLDQTCGLNPLVKSSV